MAKFLTHKALETMCDELMVEIGWERLKQRLYHGPMNIHTDRIYIKENNWPLAFEIKPENASNIEIKKGIGQAVCCLPYRVKPYLVLSQEQWDTFKDTIKFIPWLGILTYPNSSFEGNAKYKELTIKQKSIRVLSKELIIQDIQGFNNKDKE